MKFSLKRLLCAAFAGCMMFTACATAFADYEPVDTLTGVAVVENEDGQLEEQTFEYTVPTDASNDEVNAIAVQAAYEAMFGRPLTRASSYEQQELGSVRNAPIYTANSFDGYTVEADEKLSFTPDYIAVSINNASSALTTLNVAFFNERKPNATPYQANFDISDYVSINVKFYRNEDYHGQTAYMRSGDWIDARVSSNNGRSGTANVALYAISE